MKSQKGTKPKKEWHTSNSKIGMGDSYGQGIRQPVGRSRDVFDISTPKKGKLRSPPKSLA